MLSQRALKENPPKPLTAYSYSLADLQLSSLHKAKGLAAGAKPLNILRHVFGVGNHCGDAKSLLNKETAKGESVAGEPKFSPTGEEYEAVFVLPVANRV